MHMSLQAFSYCFAFSMKYNKKTQTVASSKVTQMFSYVTFGEKCNMFYVQ